MPRPTVESPHFCSLVPNYFSLEPNYYSKVFIFLSCVRAGVWVLQSVGVLLAGAVAFAPGHFLLRGVLRPKAAQSVRYAFDVEVCTRILLMCFKLLVSFANSFPWFSRKWFSHKYHGACFLTNIEVGWAKQENNKKKQCGAHA